MHRILRAALATVALLTLPQLAVAGPIQWDYLASLRPDGFERFRLDSAVSPGSEGGFAATIRGELLEGPGSGSQRIRIAALLDIDVETFGPGEAPAGSQIRSELTVTDLASGTSGTVSVFGTGTYLGDAAMLDRRVMLELLGDDDGRRELVLGENRYSIRFLTTQGTDDRISYLEADVTVAPVATPEPTTFALAGLGLCALGTVRRVQKGRAAVAV